MPDQATLDAPMCPRTIRAKARALKNQISANAEWLLQCADRIELLETLLKQATADRETCGQPVPAPPEAGVTVEALDRLAVAMDSWEASKYGSDAAEMLRALRPLLELAQRAGGVGDLEKLVEEADAKRRIIAARYSYAEFADGTIHLAGPLGNEPACPQDIPAARDWAEAQAAGRKRWSEPVRGLYSDQLPQVAAQIGCDIVHPAANYLRGWAAARGLYDPHTDRIKLPPEEATP